MPDSNGFIIGMAMEWVLGGLDSLAETLERTGRNEDADWVREQRKAIRDRFT